MVAAACDLHFGSSTIGVNTLIYIRRTSFLYWEDLLVFFGTIVMPEIGMRGGATPWRGMDGGEMAGREEGARSGRGRAAR